MAKPEKPGTYTSLPNDVMRLVMRLKISGTQLRIILAVWRYTYGFHRKEAELTDTYLAKAIDVRRNNLNREIKELFKQNILTVITRGKSFRQRSIIAFNADYTTWKLKKPLKSLETDIENDTDIEPDTITGIRNINNEIESDTNSTLETDTKGDIKVDTQEIKNRNKERNKSISNKDTTTDKKLNADKTESTNKTKYGKFVVLSAQEYSQLLSALGMDDLNLHIDCTNWWAEQQKVINIKNWFNAVMVGYGKSGYLKQLETSAPESTASKDYDSADWF